MHVSYLSLSDAVDDGLQGLIRVTLEDSLHAAGSGGDGLLHRHVQVVVVFLGCEVLDDEGGKKRPLENVFVLCVLIFLIF